MVAGRAALLVVFLITFLVLWCSWGRLDPRPNVHDEIAYVLESRIMALGHWGMPSPPIPEFWEQAHVLVVPHLAAKYFPGHSIVMVPGVWLGWTALMPLLLQSVAAVLLVVLARRVTTPMIAVLAWTLWLGAPMVLDFGASYYSESTTVVCWLGGWYALLEWRRTRRVHWLLLVAFAVGWDAITRPLTGVAYAIPMGIVVISDVIRGRRWGQLAAAMAVGTLVLGILPLWSDGITNNPLETPLTRYTRDYMPYDLPGFGFDSTPPRRAITPELHQLNLTYGSFHYGHLPSRLWTILMERVSQLGIGIWGSSHTSYAVFAAIGLVTLTTPVAFAVGSAVVLVLVYLVFSTPAIWTLYYYEGVPALALLTACGVAFTVSLARPRGSADDPRYGWKSPRWNGVLAAACVLMSIVAMLSLGVIHTLHRRDQKVLDRFERDAEGSTAERAVVFVRYASHHNPHVSFVRNSASYATDGRWFVYDRGDAENARLMRYAGDRRPYVFVEERGKFYSYVEAPGR